MVQPAVRQKVQAIRRDFIEGRSDSLLLAQKLNLSRETVNKYRREFREIQCRYPHKLHDYKFRLPKQKQARPANPRYTEMISLLPELMDHSKTRQVQLIPLWKDYRKLRPKGYSLTQFTIYYIAWRRKTNACIYTHRRLREISLEDQLTLGKWKNGKNAEWKRATVLLGSLAGRNVHEMAKQVEMSVCAVVRWIGHYQEKGLVGMIHIPAGINPAIIARTKIKQDNLIKLLHQSPSLHGINRTSWRLPDLSSAYAKVYGEAMAPTTVSANLKKLGIGYVKSREVLTSPDPKFREKLEHIQYILSHLKSDEKFFSVDEYGHFSVKLKGGRSHAKEIVIIPQVQKSKGWLIVTAALELSTNQVTHFYSRKKDTGEMIKLLKLLREQYLNMARLYISWDAATWHSSKLLTQYIAAITETPFIELAPLPNSAQFLNVIESVFSGLAKAVIHNSDYPQVEDCMLAIDRHFVERNAHFLAHPQKAGKMIWGKERVKPVFDEANNCRYHNMR
jgi:transposase